MYAFVMVVGGEGRWLRALVGVGGCCVVVGVVAAVVSDPGERWLGFCSGVGVGGMGLLPLVGLKKGLMTGQSVGVERFL